MRCCRKKFTFAISSPDEFLSIFGSVRSPVNEAGYTTAFQHTINISCRIVSYRIVSCIGCAYASRTRRAISITPRRGILTKTVILPHIPDHNTHDSDNRNFTAVQCGIVDGKTIGITQHTAHSMRSFCDNPVPARSVRTTIANRLCNQWLAMPPHHLPS